MINRIEKPIIVRNRLCTAALALAIFSRALRNILVRRARTLGRPPELHTMQ